MTVDRLSYAVEATAKELISFVAATAVDELETILGWAMGEEFGRSFARFAMEVDEARLVVLSSAAYRLYRLEDLRARTGGRLSVRHHEAISLITRSVALIDERRGHVVPLSPVFWSRIREYTRQACRDHRDALGLDGEIVDKPTEPSLNSRRPEKAIACSSGLGGRLARRSAR